MSNRIPRPPGGSPRLGRTPKPHVASSVERATAYVIEKRPLDAGDLFAAAEAALGEGALTKRNQKKLLKHVDALRTLVPPAFMPALGEALMLLQAVGTITIRPDKRTHVANQVMWRADHADRPVTPKVLLAVAVAVGCEPPTANPMRQIGLYEAWKKRHAAINRKFNDPFRVLAKAMSRRRPGEAVALPDPFVVAARRAAIRGKIRLKK